VDLSEKARVLLLEAAQDSAGLILKLTTLGGGGRAAVAKVPTARILVIDDNAAVLDILDICLRDEGYEVRGVLTGDEGWRRFVVSRPDQVLLDIALPGALDGIELLKRLMLGSRRADDEVVGMNLRWLVIVLLLAAVVALLIAILALR